VAGLDGGTIFEVIVTSVGDALTAVQGGADRLELVGDPESEGLTPTPETAAAVRHAVDVPIRVLLRSNSGYAVTRTELDRLVFAAARLREAGAEEFVLGFLDRQGRIDEFACRTLIAILDGCPVTFHRAVDFAGDRERAWAVVATLPGVDTVLTAGSPRGMDAGRPVLVREGSVRIKPALLAGGGLRTEHVAGLRRAGITAFHAGSAVRRQGDWNAPVDEAAVRHFRDLLDAPLPARGTD
jgi:copper homeostasis protein